MWHVEKLFSITFVGAACYRLNPRSWGRRGSKRSRQASPQLTKTSLTTTTLRYDQANHLVINYRRHSYRCVVFELWFLVSIASGSHSLALHEQHRFSQRAQRPGRKGREGSPGRRRGTPPEGAEPAGEWIVLWLWPERSLLGLHQPRRAAVHRVLGDPQVHFPTLLSICPDKSWNTLLYALTNDKTYYYHYQSKK